MKADSIWGKKMAMVVVDPQRKFSLPVPDWKDRMESAVEAINRFAGIFRSHGAPVIFVGFVGPSHCGYEGDDGDEWLPGLAVEDSDIIVLKEHMNCFKETDLEKILADNGIDSILFAGMLTEFCVITTYFGAGERGISPYLGKDATIPYNQEGNKAAEVICRVVSADVLERFLSGEQPEPVWPFEEGHHRGQPEGMSL